MRYDDCPLDQRIRCIIGLDVLGELVGFLVDFECFVLDDLLQD